MNWDSWLPQQQMQPLPICRQQRMHLNKICKEQCFRQRYGAIVTSLNLCRGVLSVRDGLSEMDPFNQSYLRNPQHLQKWETLLICVAKMQTVERVESASASLLVFPAQSSAPAVQNVRMSPNLSEDPDIWHFSIFTTYRHTSACVCTATKKDPNTLEEGWNMI